MHTIIKNTTSVREFKLLREVMEQRATECYENHRETFENWQEGEIAKVWIDEQETFVSSTKAANGDTITIRGNGGRYGRTKAGRN